MAPTIELGVQIPALDAQAAELVDAAITIRKNAYCIYSGFQVGASLRGKSGKIYSGCNVENCSYGAAICAERSALAIAISAGEKEFTSLAVCAQSMDSKNVFPCGICRQSLSEFVDEDFPVYLSCPDKKTMSATSLGHLLPHCFSRKNLLK